MVTLLTIPVGYETEFSASSSLLLRSQLPNGPEDMLAPKEPDHSSVYHLKEIRGVNYIMSPGQLLGQIKFNIHMLLEMGYYIAEFGGILYERIGTIRLMQDGELRKEWGLELAQLKFNESFGSVETELRPAGFEDWKSNAHRTCIHLYLPCYSGRDEQGESTPPPGHLG